MIAKYKDWRRRFLGNVLRRVFSSSRLRVGRGVTCDGLPEFSVDRDASVEIGDNVIFRRNVEIRVHKGAKLIIGSGTRVDRGARLLATNGATLSIGRDVIVGLYSVLNGGDSITIGDKCMISGFVYLQTSMHNHRAGGIMKDQGYSHAPIVLEDDVWVGAHATVLPGVRLGRGAIVGSNAVATAGVGPEEIAVGVPARVIGRRGAE